MSAADRASDSIARAVVVRDGADVPEARRMAATVARASGLCEVEVAEVALVASELATNLARYAPGGTLWASTAGQGCLRLVSSDDGPGMADPVEALRNGYSTGGGLGEGLGVVQRLMDTFTVRTAPTGTRIEVTKCCVHRTP